MQRTHAEPRTAPETVTYRTWIRTSRLYVFAAISMMALAGASLTLVSAWFALLLVPAALFGYIAVVLALTVWRFGPRGGNFQRRIHDLIVARAAVDPAGRGLDIGCGSGALTIALAKALPAAQVTGIDFWARTGSTPRTSANATRGSKGSLSEPRSCNRARRPCSSTTPPSTPWSAA